MSPPLVTPLYAGLLSLFFVGRALAVSRLRVRLGIPLGDGNQSGLRRAIRVHGNFAEYVPLALVLLLMVELAGFSSWLLHLLGLMLLGGRLLHAYGLSRVEGFSRGRFVGTILTLVMIGACSLLLLLHVAGRVLL